MATGAPQEYKEGTEPRRSEQAVRRFDRAGITATHRPTPIREGSVRVSVLGREGHYRRALALADAVVGALVLVGIIILANGEFEPATLVGVPALLLMSKLAGLYDRDELVMTKSTLDEAPALLQLSGTYALVVWLLHSDFSSFNIRPLHVLALWGGGAAALVAGRSLARLAARRLSPTERCLLVGDPVALEALKQKFGVAHLKVDIVAAVAIAKDDGGPTGDFLRELVRTYDIHRVVIAPASTDARETLDLVRAAKSAGVRVSVLPRLFEVVGSAVEFDQLHGLVVLGIRRFGLTRSSRWLKRSFDLVGASIVLVVFLPVVVAVALAIRLESRGSIFFRQTRIGRDGRPFQMIKFRSMVIDADAQKDALLDRNESFGLFKIADDPRMTRVGRFLRRSCLDELPQLINVLRGEMSLVGPRPLVTEEDARVQGLDRERLHLTPGMTGHWQVLGSSRIPMHEMVAIDYLYVANWSLWADLKILLRTVPYILARRGQ